MGHKVKFIGCIGEYVKASGVLFMETKHGNGASGMSNSDETSTVKHVHSLPGKQEGIIMRQYAIDFIPVGLPEIEADILQIGQFWFGEPQTSKYSVSLNGTASVVTVVVF